MNENAGLWAFVALPLLVVATAIAAAQLLPVLRTAVRTDAQNIKALQLLIKRRRVDFDIPQRLVFGKLLDARLDAGSGAKLSAEDLYAMVRDGSQVFVVGGPGAGKSVLALTLVSHSLEQSREDPEQPLMEVVSLRDWRERFARKDDWKSLTAWMASRLTDLYPSVDSRYLQRLIVSQRLVPCLDGLDEVPKSSRPFLMTALRSYTAAGLPLVVLSRDRGLLPLAAEESDSDASTPGFELIELAPLAEDAYLEVGDEWESWQEFIDNSDQPGRAVQLLRTPLLLSLAAVAWRPSERPKALASGEDPVDVLWRTFFWRHLGPVAAEKTGDLRRAAGWVALLARQRNLDTFRVSELYTVASASAIAAAICAVPVLIVSWEAGLLGLGTIMVFTLSIGLGPLDRHWIWRLAQKRTRGWSSDQKKDRLAIALLIAIPTVTTVGDLFESLLKTELVTDDGIKPLWLHPFEGRGLASWWENNGWDVVRATFTLSTLAPMPLIFGAAFMNLTSRSGIESLLPRRIPSAVVPLVALIAIGLGIATPRGGLALLGAFAIAPWVYLGVSRLLLARKPVPARRLREACRQMAESGIVHMHDGTFRFRHDELSRRLAAEAMAELAERGRVGLLPYPESTIDLIERRTRVLDPDSVECLVKELVRVRPDVDVVLGTQTIFLYYARLKPKAAMPALLAHTHRFPNSICRGFVADVLDASGRHDDATLLWSEVKNDYPRSLWAVYKWAERQVSLGCADIALKALTKINSATRAGEVTIATVLFCELRCRFGTSGERQAAVAMLERMRGVGHQYLAARSGLELARVNAEVHGERDWAEEALATMADENVFRGLRYARHAQLRAAVGDVAEAQRLARIASWALCWDEGPSSQLEVHVTVAALGGPEAAEARDRAEALLGFGWRLPGRDELINMFPPEGCELASRAINTAVGDSIRLR